MKMTEPVEDGVKPINLKVILVTAVLTAFFSILTGIAVNWINSPRLRLTYSITAQHAFEGTTERVDLLAVRVSNLGSRELEDVVCTVSFAEGEVRECVVKPSTTQTTQVSKQSVEVKFPYMNPGEYSTLQILSEPMGGGNVRTPRISLRAKGSVGIEETPVSPSSESILPTIAAVGAAIASSASLIASRFSRRLIRSRTGIGDDKRDDVAQCLSLAGLHALANQVRLADRELPYWGHADLIADFALTATPTESNQAIMALQMLLDDAPMASSSKAIVRCNIARVADHLGDGELRDRHLQAVLASGSSINKNRYNSISRSRPPSSKSPV